MKKTLLALSIVATFTALTNGCSSKLNQVRTQRSINTIVVHHTAGKSSNNVKQLSQEINRLHHRKFPEMRKSKGLHIAYHYLITPDGKVWQTREQKHIGHHAGNWNVNKHSLAICLVGDFSKHKPTRNQVKSLNDLVRRIKRKYSIRRVFPHSHCRATLCCGEYLKREIRKLSWGRNF